MSEGRNVSVWSSKCQFLSKLLTLNTEGWVHAVVHTGQFKATYVTILQCVIFTESPCRALGRGRGRCRTAATCSARTCVLGGGLDGGDGGGGGDGDVRPAAATTTREWRTEWRRSKGGTVESTFYGVLIARL